MPIATSWIFVSSNEFVSYPPWSALDTTFKFVGDFSAGHVVFPGYSEALHYTEFYNITEILLKMTLNTHILTKPSHDKFMDNWYKLWSTLNFHADILFPKI